MTKAWLSSHGVDFEVLDVASDPAALAALRARGLSTVPAVIVGDQYLTGWNPQRLAALVGRTHEERVPSPEELIDGLLALLDAALRATRQVPDDCWELQVPGRSRPLRELVRHLFEVIERGMDADVLGIFPAQQWLPDRDVPALTGAARLARYGEAVRAKVATWYAVREPERFARVIDADVGPRTLTQVLDRTRHHAAQHLRQVYALLENSGITPEAPLTLAALRQLGIDQLPPEVF
ncbi:MAG: DinB family protein [Chloroflexi bacterium]|nr:DinB family protein [Chloroflexota bacterium]